MNNIFHPTKILQSIYDIDFKQLKQNGIKGLILDIDNTLVAHGIEEANDKVISWIQQAEDLGMKVCIVSNNTEDRVIKFNEKLKVPTVHRATKPRKWAFIKASKIMDVSVKEIAVIGDQVFTDVLGGNRLGMVTILVTPIHTKEPVFIKFKRLLEKLVLRGYKQ